jgi:hypothetical protein
VKLLLNGLETPETIVGLDDPMIVELSVDASDDVGVKSVEYFRKTTTEETSLGVANGPFSFSWSLAGTPTSSGPYTLFARAKDAAGNKGESPPVDVQLEVPYTAWSVDGQATSGETPSAIDREADGTLAIAAQCTLPGGTKKGWKLLRLSTTGTALTDLCMPIYDDPDALADHRPTTLAEGPSGEAYMAGYITTTNAGQARDGRVIRLSAAHATEWTWDFNGSAGLDDEIHSIALNADGTLLAVAGITAVDANVNEAFFVLLDPSTGQLVLGPVVLDGLGGKASGESVMWTSDNGLVFAINIGPYTLPGHGDNATFTSVYKIDSTLSTTLWQQNVGQAADGQNFVTEAMREGPGGSVILCGTSTSIVTGTPPTPDATVTAAWASRLRGDTGALSWQYLDSAATSSQPSTCHGIAIGGSSPRLLLTGSVKQSNIEGSNARATMARWLDVNTGAVVRSSLLATSNGVFGQAVVAESTGFYTLLQGYDAPAHLRVTRLFQP